MYYKSVTLDHIVDAEYLIRKIREGSNYTIPHPNIDNYNDHMYVTMIYESSEGKNSVIYTPRTEKGKSLYEMFSLGKLCIDTLDRSQGIDNSNIDLYHIMEHNTLR